MNRYARQTQLEAIGASGTARLRGATVLIVGLGGLGCPVLQYLAGAGTGYLRLADPDTVDLHNLHRQTLYEESQIGEPKVECAARWVKAHNSDVIVDAQQCAFGPLNADALLRDIDLVLDCTDGLAPAYMISDACHARRIPLIAGAAVGLKAYVGGFCAGAPSLRAVFPNPPSAQARCSDVGVLGSVVGMAGSLQAQMALSHIAIGQPAMVMGMLLSFDMKTFSHRRIRFDAAPEPASSIPFIEAAQLQPDDYLIELRDPIEAPTPVRPDAQRLDGREIDVLVREAEGRRTVLCCSSGLRAWRAASMLCDAHLSDLALLPAGAPDPTHN